jgi:hypothetical protein
MSDRADTKAPKVPTVRGRPFANGNAGRRPGSRNRATVIACALLEGETKQLVRKAVELAKGGDVPMLKFFLGRLLPRERVVKLDLPHMEFADDAVEAPRRNNASGIRGSDQPKRRGGSGYAHQLLHKSDRYGRPSETDGCSRSKSKRGSVR